MFKILALFFIYFSTSVFAANSLCELNLDDVPVLAGGRVKPLYVLSQESLKFLTGSSKPHGVSSTTTFCELSFSYMGLDQSQKLMIKIDHPSVREFLGLKKGELNIEVNTLLAEKDRLRIQMMKIKENNSERKELQKVMTRISVYENIIQGQAWTFATLKNNELEWMSLADYITPERVAEMKTETGNPILNVIENSKTNYKMKGNNKFLLELHYFKVHYFSWALVISLAALLLTFSVKNIWFGFGVTSLSILVQIIGIIIRVLISGRAPITNMYETVMFSGFGALLLSYFLTLFKKNKSFLMGGLTYNILCLMMMMMANNMLDSSISPLVPVLRDNFWLSTHVTTVILSYAALALSWVLANVSLIRSRFFNQNYKIQEELHLIYTAIKFGVVLLAAGVILGGIWADYSWGRFWGWDPKETWSLIVLLVYIAILHGRYTQWITPSRFIPLVAGAFMSVVMAWFGVNYILASGLHSYGFSEGGAIFIGSVFLVQAIILVVTTIKPTKPASI